MAIQPAPQVTAHARSYMYVHLHVLYKYEMHTSQILTVYAAQLRHGLTDVDVDLFNKRMNKEDDDDDTDDNTALHQQHLVSNDVL